MARRCATLGHHRAVNAGFGREDRSSLANRDSADPQAVTSAKLRAREAICIQQRSFTGNVNVAAGADRDPDEHQRIAPRNAALTGLPGG